MSHRVVLLGILCSLLVVVGEILPPGPDLVEMPWTVPNALSQDCWLYNVVPFMFKAPPGFPFSEEQLVPIRLAVDTFNNHTCLKWVDATVMSVESKQYVVFNKTVDSWCRMSRVRNVTSGVRYTVINLNAACLAERAVHMMMHALGFRHEHQRSDRDCYVLVDPLQLTSEKYKIQPQPAWEERYPYDKFSALHEHSNFYIKSLTWFGPDPDTTTKPPCTRHCKDFYVKSTREPLGSAVSKLTKMDISKIKYKFCKGKHFCTLQPDLCQRAEDMKRQKNCTSWRFTDPGRVLPPEDSIDDEEPISDDR